MATLAIKGHATRGSKVIGLLEMLGGRNTYNNNTGSDLGFYYSIENGEIKSWKRKYLDDSYMYFTLEEFLEKYPYKVGDKVLPKCYSHPVPRVIEKMWFDGSEVCYYTNNKGDEFTANELQPYTEPKEESMEKTIKIDIPKGYEFAGIDDDNQQVVFEKIGCQYPKTYTECCKVLGINELPYMAYTWNRNEDVEVVLQEYQVSLIEKLNTFRTLLTCRDAYWKIAGDWKSDWEDDTQKKYIIYTTKNKAELAHAYVSNNILAFPTEEMCNTFYENFKDLIESCKELL